MSNNENETENNSINLTEVNLNIKRDEDFDDVESVKTLFIYFFILYFLSSSLFFLIVFLTS